MATDGANPVETVAAFAQLYLQSVPCMVVGTGATIPHGLPSMGGLAQHIREVVTPGDGEHPTWTSFLQELDVDGDLERALQAVEVSESLVDQVVRETWQLVNAADLRMLAALVPDRNLLPLSRYLRFLLRTATPQIDVITTNYDRMIEYAADAVRSPAYDGFSPGLVRHFDLSAERSPARSEWPHRPAIRVWKVHGSLDWFSGPLDEPVSVPLQAEIPAALQPLIVTPGVSKYRKTHAEPFRTVMTEADAALSRASCFLCIGYGFNDEHVQPRLVQQVRHRGAPVVVVTRTLSAAGRELLLSGEIERFLIIERCDSGSRVYHPGSPAGHTIAGRDFWSLDGFLDLLVPDEERGL